MKEDQGEGDKESGFLYRRSLFIFSGFRISHCSPGMTGRVVVVVPAKFISDPDPGAEVQWV